MIHEREFYQGDRAPDPSQQEQLDAQKERFASLFATVFGTGVGRQVLDIIKTKFRAEEGMLESPVSGDDAIRDLTLRRAYWWIYRLAKTGERIEIV